MNIIFSDCTSDVEVSLPSKIIAIIISFNPEQKTLLGLLYALIPQVYCTIVVDNASSTTDLPKTLSPFLDKKVELLQMPENQGIAAAQNVGIEKAIQLGADYVLLSDQDSLPSGGMVATLLNVFDESKRETNVLPVAAVGPAIDDKRTGVTSFFVIEKFSLPGRWQSQDHVSRVPSQLDVGFLISSGTLIPVNVIKDIGAMRSNYFIDHVDTEWCFRAKAAGYRLIGSPKTRLIHELGDKVKQIWFFGARQVMYHAPFRDYYTFRNTLLMLQDTSMSWPWRIHFLWRLLQFAGYFLVFAGERRQRLGLMTLGLIHGFKRISGRLDMESRKCKQIPISNIEPDFTLR